MNTLSLRPRFSRSVIAMIILWQWAAVVSAADFSLDPMFTDNMVLQQSEKGLEAGFISGRADKGEKIWVEFQENNQRAKMAEDGTWKVKLSKLDANLPPANLTIRAGKKDGKVLVQRSNVVVGEVWVLGVSAPVEAEFNPVRLERFLSTIQRDPGQRLRVLTFSPGAGPAAAPVGPMAWRVAQPEDARPGARRFSIWRNWRGIAVRFSVPSALNPPRGHSTRDCWPPWCKWIRVPRSGWRRRVIASGTCTFPSRCGPR